LRPVMNASRRTIAFLTGQFLLGTVLRTSLAAGSPSAGIDAASFVRIGGIDQWISIKGANQGNPVLLVVHGGPGEAQWPQAEMYAPWTKAFTVVQWDQRGAGHTYGRYRGQTPNMSLERIAEDGIELAEYLCHRLSRKKIIVLGHSWGSIVAVRMTQLRPALFAAYVGTGQVASWKATVDAQFELLQAKARQTGDRAALEQFEAIGTPDPTNAQQYFEFTKGCWQPPGGSTPRFSSSRDETTSSHPPTRPLTIASVLCLFARGAL
jgi:pimeloyl-ACP methyl ester carboxylesterase